MPATTAVTEQPAAPKTRQEMTWHERRAAKAERERQARLKLPNASDPELALRQVMSLVDRFGEGGAQREITRLRPVAMKLINELTKAPKRRRARRPASAA